MAEPLNYRPPGTQTARPTRFGTIAFVLLGGASFLSLIAAQSQANLLVVAALAGWVAAIVFATLATTSTDPISRRAGKWAIVTAFIAGIAIALMAFRAVMVG